MPQLLRHQFVNEPKAIDNRRENATQKPPLDPDVADAAPSGPLLTAHDTEHAVTYVRLLDAEGGWR